MDDNYIINIMVNIQYVIILAKLSIPSLAAIKKKILLYKN